MSTSFTTSRTAFVDVTRGHDWGWLLRWLAGADGIDTHEWRTRFADALDLELLVERVATGVADKIPGAVDFIHSLTQLAPLASSVCIRAIAPEVARLIESDLPAASHALVDWCLGESIPERRARTTAPSSRRSGAPKWNGGRERDNHIMGIYRERVVPRIMNILMNTKETREIRERVCIPLRGEVVEIGFGTGHNLPFMPAAVTQLHAVEPLRRARELAAGRVAEAKCPVEFVGLDGQQLPLADRSADALLST